MDEELGSVIVITKSSFFNLRWLHAETVGVIQQGIKKTQRT
jgi:hypothetical protein